MDLQVLKTAARHWAIALSLCLPVQGCKQPPQEAKIPHYNTPDLTPVWQADKAIHTIADFQFTDQLGNSISNKDLDGKIYVANFFFTMCPGICPKLKNNIQLVADTFKSNQNIQFISHSVTPYIDSVPKLKEYADMHGIDAGQWHLVTGDKGEIYTIARRSYFAEDEPGFNKDSTDFLHTERVVLVDKHRHIRGVYNGTVKLEMNRLIDDIHLLLKEE